MIFYSDTDWDCLLLLPYMAIHEVKCDKCDESHGWAFSIGWLVWTAGIGFEEDPH